MVSKSDLELLERNYQTALANVDKIKRTHGYPYYPKEISDFMHSLCFETWVNHSYRANEISNILSHIEQADFNEIREVLTAVSRAERFCDGSWEETLSTKMLDPVFARLREIVN